MTGDATSALNRTVLGMYPKAVCKEADWAKQTDAEVSAI
jgi:hypothetical protein